MNKFLTIMGLLVLVGAGCTAQTEVKTDVDAGTNKAGLEVKANTQASGEAEGSGENSGTEGSAEGTTTTTIDAGEGVELVVETETDGTVDGEADEDDNVIDVVLGADVDVMVNMEVANFSFTPNVINAKAGDRVKVTFAKNSGFHTFNIDEIDLSTAISQGESVEFTAPSTPGTYKFYCDIGSHRSMGLEGSLIVK